MVLYIVGLGLATEKDVTLRGEEAIRRSKRVYLESYTSVLGVGKERLESFYSKQMIVADREMVESDEGCDSILSGADVDDVSFLVVGDPFGATTHADILLRARKHEPRIRVEIIHNASIMNAIGAAGLPLYDYGPTVSIPFFTDTWRPSSWIEKVEQNLQRGCHTLCLLDIKVKEISEMNLARGKKIYEPPRFMNPTTALQQMLECIEVRSTSAGGESTPSLSKLSPKTEVIIASRVGSETEQFCRGTIEGLAAREGESYGEPLHCLVVVCGETVGPVERELLDAI
ncbi:Diphthine synthase [Atractiella rhizophila]|nr:Diphthine synthase [Atractiella rhizophila]